MREKTESEKLQEETQKQFVAQKIGELNKYLDYLFKELAESGVFYMRNQALNSICLLVWMLSVIARAYYPLSFWAILNENLANLLFWLMLLRVWLFCVPWNLGAINEIRGCLKTLEHLGMIDPLDSDRHKKLKIAEESKIAKLWDWLKQKARSEAYMPA